MFGPYFRIQELVIFSVHIFEHNRVCNVPQSLFDLSIAKLSGLPTRHPLVFRANKFEMASKRFKATSFICRANIDFVFKSLNKLTENESLTYGLHGQRKSIKKQFLGKMANYHDSEPGPTLTIFL